VPAEAKVDPIELSGTDSELVSGDFSTLDVHRFTRSSAAPPETLSALDAAPAGACRYLHLAGRDDVACLALTESVQLSWRQAELVCLPAAHVGCPRFTHGGIGERPLPPTRLTSAIGAIDTKRSSDSNLRGGVAAVAVAAADAAPAPDAVAAVVAPAPDVSEVTASVHGVSTDAGLAEPPVVPAVAPIVAPTAGPTVEPIAEPHALVVDHPMLQPSSATRVPVNGDRGPGPPGSAGPPRAAIGRPSSTRRIAAQAHRRAVALRPATLVSLVVLVIAFALAVTFVAARGGLSVPVAGEASSSVRPGAQGSSSPNQPSTRTAPPSVIPSTPIRSPAPTRTPRPTSTPRPSGSVAPSLAPDVLALLAPCPQTPNCYQYRVRPGDNLRGIAKRFGVSYNSVLDLNPAITKPSLIHVGQLIRLPPPNS
jgi:hypothetical protein